MWACPTEALVMHMEGKEPPRLRVPDLDDYYQTAIPGQYLIGEVAGKPLVKNAANLGRGVIEHMIATGLQPGTMPGGDAVDVLIVGSGPGGLSAALTCHYRGLSYIVLEKEQFIASTIALYPKGKLVMAEPYDCRNLSFLPVFDSTKEELVPLWGELLERVGVRISLGETVETAKRSDDGFFDIETNVNKYRAARVVLATGTRGKPRTLGVCGENLPKVVSLLDDPGAYRGRAVLVVGGGDSALEATIALADAGAKVILSYRGRSFSRAQPKIRGIVEAYQKQRRIKINYQSVVTELTEDTVTLQMSDGSLKKYPNEAAFVLIGSEPPIRWLAKLGINTVEKPHTYALPKSDELVSYLLSGSVRDCPESAQAAAALVQGATVLPEPVKAPQKKAEPSGRKWLRSATSLFGVGKRRLDRPMTLSEFARKSRKHTGAGRRDQLDAPERTRVLRMLRDEGARLADEESSIEVFRPPTGQVQWAEDAESFGRAESPPLLEEQSPKQAVIVGLAEAAARGPRVGRSSRISPPGPDAPNEARIPNRVDTGELLANLIRQDRATKQAQGSPAPGRIHEQPTRVVGVDPEQLLQQAPGAASPEEPTAMVEFERMIAEEAAPSPRVFSDSVKLNSSYPQGDSASGVLASDSPFSSASPEPDRIETFEENKAGPAHEDHTRQLQLDDENRANSLSDVDFDFDFD